MSDSLLSVPDFRPLAKAAARALIAACAAPGQTGPQRACDLLGVSPGTISKWSRDEYDDQMPISSAMRLEFLLQRPFVTQAFASLTSHRLVAVEDADGSDCLMAGFFATLERIGSLQRTWVEAAADGKHTPGERKALKAELMATIDLLNAQVRKLGTAPGDGGAA